MIPPDYFGTTVPTAPLELAANLLFLRIAGLLAELGVDMPAISSGYRSPEHNAKIGGAKKSLHTLGRAVDFKDPDHTLYKAIAQRPELLKKYRLWMEDGNSTPTWVHLDTGVRFDRRIRIFKP